MKSHPVKLVENDPRDRRVVIRARKIASSTEVDQ